MTRPRLDLPAVREYIDRPFHFIRAFRAAFRSTPHQYLRARRIERAKELLETTALPVTEICDRIGFQSLGSFSSLFRRLTGLTPAQYRAKYRTSAYIPSCFIRMYRAGQPFGGARGKQFRRSAVSGRRISSKT